MPEDNVAVCLVCGGSNPRRRYQITRFQVLECTDCAQIFLHPLPSEREIHELFAELYSTGGGSVPELKSYYGFCYEDSPSNPLVQLYSSWLDKIEARHPVGTLLDVGSGTGLFLAVAKRRGWEVYGIDSSVEATGYAREHFDLDLWVGDFADFGARGQRFDVITGWDIIEHSRDPVALLAAMRGCLAPGGSVVLSTPNQHSILDVIAGAMYRLTGGMLTQALEKFYIEQHFLYFTPDSLGRALERGGLTVAAVEPEITDLRRLTLNPLMRLTLMTMFAISKLVGLENRIFMIASASDDVPHSEASRDD